MNFPTLMRATALATATMCSLSVQAADWSDTSIGYRYGTDFAEPFNNSAISKDILNLNHVSGYKYGTNFFNADLLLSDNKDSPTTFGVPSEVSAGQEVYVVYRNTVDLSKVTAGSYKFGPVRAMGITAGFDFNTKSGDELQLQKADAGRWSDLHDQCAGIPECELACIVGKQCTLWSSASLYATTPMPCSPVLGVFLWVPCLCPLKVLPTSSPPRAKTSLVATQHLKPTSTCKSCMT